MIAAIHQPNYAPWIGFFDKMARADVFVYLDDVQFSKNGYQNRVQIKSPRGPEWLTVPVLTAGSFAQATIDVRLDPRAPWPRKHVARLEEAYGKTPGWTAVRDTLLPAIGRGGDRLVPLNLAVIDRLRVLLGIATRVVRSSELVIEGSSTDQLISICRAVGADTYFTGDGSSYLDEARFSQAGIALVRQDFRHPRYRQPHGEFAAGMSVIDLLCAEGEAAPALLRAAAAS